MWAKEKMKALKKDMIQRGKMFGSKQREGAGTSETAWTVPRKGQKYGLGGEQPTGRKWGKVKRSPEGFTRQESGFELNSAMDKKATGDRSNVILFLRIRNNPAMKVCIH